MLRANEDSRIDRVMISDGQDGARLAKVRTRRECVPQVGDKFSSMHGQKGTMGAMLSQEDMPWCASGLVPDIIINPHAVPSRQTIAMLIEMLMGKAAALKGAIGDGTPFSHATVEQIGDVLHSLGMQRHGSEVMYSGQTGEQLEAMIFIGPCFYQRLKHLSAEKIHGRGLGPRTALTHQPVEGRGKDGGLRYGEMVSCVRVMAFV
jgi:DNA-directed RNA polymerase II subunit RPB2